MVGAAQLRATHEMLSARRHSTLLHENTPPPAFPPANPEICCCFTHDVCRTYERVSPVRNHARTHTHTHTHTQVSLSILTARGGVLGSGLELRQPRPSGLRLDRADDPFETRLVRGSSVGFELGFETGVVLWSNPTCLVCGGGSEKKGVGGWWCNAAETGLGSGGRSRLGVVKLVGW